MFRGIEEWSTHDPMKWVGSGDLAHRITTIYVDQALLLQVGQGLIRMTRAIEKVSEKDENTRFV